MLSIALLISSAAFATTLYKPAADEKGAADITGKYEGAAKSESFGDIPLTVNLKNTSGKISGTIETPQGPASITGGTYADGKVTLKFDAGGNEGTVTATVNGDKIVGKWELGGAGGTLELKRSGAAMATAPTTGAMAAPMATAGDPLSGIWDGSADAGGMTIPFKLTLKLADGKVTGTSESDQGSVQVSNGKFDGNKLTFTLDTPQGSIALTGMVKDGKINGDFDFAGQMQGKWEAKKK
jgi:hypothetical protein